MTIRKNICQKSRLFSILLFGLLVFGCFKTETLIAVPSELFDRVEQSQNLVNSTVAAIQNEIIKAQQNPELEYEPGFEPPEEVSEVTIADLDENGQAFAWKMIDQIHAGNAQVDYREKVLAGPDVEKAIIHELTPTVRYLEDTYGMVFDEYEPKLIEMSWNNDVFANLNMENVQIILDRENRAQTILNWMNETLASIPRDATMRQAYSIIHGAITGLFTYDISRLDTRLSDNLIDGRAVCEGYARGIKLLCDAYGIPAVVVHGNSSDGAHIWNEVEIDGVWYSSDPTWDDQNNHQSQSWMLVAPEKFRGHETWLKEEL